MGLLENLEKILEQQGLKPIDLADKSGVPTSRISEIVTGKTKNPQMKTLQKLAQALGVTVDSLTGDPPPRPGIRSGLQQLSVPASGQGCGSCPSRHSSYIEKVAAMMEDMDEDTQKDICLSVEKEKLLRELIKERQEKEAA